MIDIREGSLLEYMLSEDIDPEDYVIYKKKLREALDDYNEYRENGKDESWYEDTLAVLYDTVEQIRTASSDIEAYWTRTLKKDTKVNLEVEMQHIKEYLEHRYDD